VATDGNDSWSGTLARAECPQHRRSVCHDCESSDGCARDSGVILKGGLRPSLSKSDQGTVFPRATIILSRPADSGTSQLQVNWENYPAETPLISGGLHWASSGLSCRMSAGTSGRFRCRRRHSISNNSSTTAAAVAAAPRRISGNVLSRGRDHLSCRFIFRPCAPIPTARSMLVEADGNVSIDFSTVPAIPSAQVGRILIRLIRRAT